MIKKLRTRLYRFRISANGFLQGNHKIVTTYIYRHDLDQIPIVSPKVNCRLEEIFEGEISEIHQIWPTSLDKMKQRFDRGDRCFAVYVDDQIAHYSWVQVGGYHFLQPAGRRMFLLDSEAMFFHVRVASWAQGKGIATFGYTEALRLLKQISTKTALVYTTCDNIASQKSIEKAGWRISAGFRALQLNDSTFIPLPSRMHFQ